ncbi:hypothetical protein BKA67DRAFT_656724 [Truncatella angustata]|uniref:RING-type domain-containing protein n=1 Tax=Truncatella angustata TaxID=152316 RepID=A0A9P9A2T1_9PEZI|nr:uncharacterized protein BKA67DRAFT_656724 [Truncatella angustata]KAH6658536.1 hypothetical protein BKA67DRAFT_656724 [Truncatella angustata]
MAELQQVTEYRGHRDERWDCDGQECPICLASLYSCTETGSIVDGGIDLEVGPSRGLTTSGSPPTKSSVKSTHVYLKEAETDVKPWRPQPINDDVVKLKRCQHLFHARCLASWFLRKRYDCPVCRTSYYQESGTKAMEDRGRELTYQPSIAIAPFF